MDVDRGLERNQHGGCYKRYRRAKPKEGKNDPRLTVDTLARVHTDKGHFSIINMV